MRRILLQALASLFALFYVYAQTPSIQSLAAVSPTTNRNSLLTVGGETLILRGLNFGTSAAALTYIGPSPFQNGFTVRYTPRILQQNDTTIQFITSPGVGGNLQFTVVRFANNATGTSGVLASYANPSILNITGIGTTNPFALRPQGGDFLRITGRNFGPRTYPGYPWIYTPWVRFGGTPGTWAWMQSCSRTAADFDSVITCRVPVGGGTNHSVRVNGGYTGQWSPIDRNITVSFITPTVLSTTPTITSMTTAGGDQIVIRGLNMPYPSWVIQGFCPISASFGLFNTTGGVLAPPFRYIMRSCTGAFDGDGRTPVITCLTPEGTGRGFSLSVNVGGLFTNLYINPQIGYAPPVIYDFAGANQDASTLGNETVLINGKNFGNNATLVRAKYTLQLKSPIGSLTNYTYISPICSISINHTQLACKTAPGVGQDLIWTVTVDGQDNVSPKTAYTTPKITGYEVRNATTLSLKRAASTEGGDMLYIYGSGFGPRGLNTIKDAVAVSPFGLTIPLTNTSLLNDGLVTTSIPPGGGSGWTTIFKVADIETEPTVANYSYANPTVVSLTPAVGPTIGGSLITVVARDLAILNSNVLTSVIFGNPNDGSLQPQPISSSLIPRPDSDNITKTPYLPGLVSFRLPPGVGLRRYVRLISYLSTDSIPDPQTVSIENGAYFDYADPIITNAVLSQPNTPQQQQNALDFFGSDAVATNQVRILTVYGSNFGQGVYPLTLRTLQYLNGSWFNSTGQYQFIPTDWTDSMIVVYTLQNVGTIRILFGSMDVDSTIYLQYSNSFTYNDFSPTISASTSGPFQTVGGQTLTLTASYLSSATGFNITVGGIPADILDPSTGQQLLPSQILNRILINPNAYSPPGAFTPNTIWTFPIRIPVGQGRQVPLLISRLPDGAVSAPAFIGYAGPTLTTINGQPFDQYTRYLSPTLGTQFIFKGTNFGPCPTITVATYSIRSCTDQPGSISSDHTTLTVQMPEGEGLGTQLLGTSAGWTLQIQAADQFTPDILFGWDAPVLTQLVYSSVPTTGGSLLTLNGLNFGASVPGYPQSILPSPLKIQILMNSSFAGTLFCSTPIRISHTQLQCNLPPAAGNFDISVSIAGQQSISMQRLSYDQPLISHFMYNSSIVQNTTIQQNTTLILQGINFGPSVQYSCIFFSNRRNKGVPICNGQEDYFGEGEQLTKSILAWNHTHIYVQIPPGTGSPIVQISVWGTITDAESLRISYPPPILLNMSRISGPAAGGYPVVLTTSGIGAMNIEGSYPRALPSPWYSPIQIDMNGFCISSTPKSNCIQGISTFSDTSLPFLIPEGIGANYSFRVFVDDSDIQIVSNFLEGWSYDPPSIQQLLPNPVYIGIEKLPSIILQGINFGTPQAFLNFPSADKSLVVYVSQIQQQTPKRITTETLPVGIEFILDGTTQVAGRKQIDLFVAGQRGVLLNNSYSALMVYCEKDFFAKDGELCIECPSGAICPGSLFYPYAKPGFFNLNSSYANAEVCPASAILTNPDGRVRDVCIVACSPSEACIGGNLCAAGYKSASPAYRCNVCEKGYYKRANECIRCPDSPVGVIIACICVIMVLSAVGYVLNKKNVNLAFLSIAIDYFQIISIFLQSKIAWPPIIKNLMYVLSAFNFNLDIVAPECLVPDISYSQKFYFIQSLPLALIGFLGLVNLGYIGYKAFIKGRNSKDLMRHVGAFKSAGIIILYFLYLYITRTLLDIFNCAPTIPPTYDSSGNIMTYLSVQFEQCGKPGGLQMTLMPVAILGIVFYSIGFPALIGYVLFKHKLNIMFDQLLRAQEEGQDRFENPIAYETRKAYSRLYYQYKPDFFAWALIILGRKFCIALTTVMFVTNAAFQMAVCLLILFIGYSLQTRFNPFMCYTDYEDVIKQHLDAVSWSKTHMQVNAMLITVHAQNRIRRKTHNNSIFTATGFIDKRALFKAMGSWMFNYNTVEATMLFCGVIVCLMGIMYQTSTIVAGYDGSNRDVITGVVLFVIIGSIFYLFTVFCIEIYLATIQENNKQIGKKFRMPSSKRLAIQDSTADMGGKTETNPMMLKSRFSKQINVDDFDEPPPAALWPLFKQMFKSNNETIKTLNETITELKKEVQNVAKGGEFEMVSPVRIIKREIRQKMTPSVPAME